MSQSFAALQQPAAPHAAPVVRPHLRRYIPEIDGLRALAVLLVVFCHAKFVLFAGGYIGVDVFFVISGYVVCGSILADQDTDAFHLKDFYARRLKRLAPSLYLMAALTLVFGLIYCFPDNNVELLKNIGFLSLFAANVYLAKQTGYFDLEAERHPLLHTWSLSVEEQFYLVIPLLLIALRNKGRWFKVGLLSALWAGFFAYSCYRVAHPSPGAYYYLQGRVFEFLVGILLAVYFHKFAIRARSAVFDVLLLAGLALIGWCGLHYDARTAMPGMAALWPCLGAALVIVGIQGARHAGLLLRNGAAAFTGKISYVLYLWHWPVIFAFIRLELNTPHWMAAAIALSVVLAVATHYLVEQPLRKATWSPKKSALLLFAAPVAVALALLGAARVTDNFTLFYPEKYRLNQLASGRTVFKEKRADTCWTKSGITPEQQCTVGDTGSPMKAVLWGDSHAYHLIDFMDQLGKDNRLAIHDLTFTMCAPIENSPARAGDPGFQKHAEECRSHGLATMRYILSQPDVKVVLMAATWDIYTNATPGANPPPSLHGFLPGQINAELAGTIVQLEAAGKKVVFVDDIPILPPALEDCVANKLYLPSRQASSCTYPRSETTARYQLITSVLGPMTARFPRTAILHTYDVPCDDAVCRSELLDTPLYSHNDRGHLGSGGSAVYYRAYKQRHPGEASRILALP
jgi:peptidoglycan/LPS O-acetylase OafA/YrhL